MKFIALDVETANSSLASICSIGMAVFEKDTVVSEWYSLINPLDQFSPINSRIHGITENEVLSAPTFKDVMAELAHTLEGEIVVTHTHCDRTSL
ncbi:exonuclease domain-containing protein, partial [Roseicyclus sp.]|uniref:exonuclease domain-containing protein n=1 Tax=Roseicyclus sp. TaxID=1914329 RepID=UPI003F6C9AA8